MMIQEPSVDNAIKPEIRLSHSPDLDAPPHSRQISVDSDLVDVGIRATSDSGHCDVPGYGASFGAGVKIRVHTVLRQLLECSDF